MLLLYIGAHRGAIPPPSRLQVDATFRLFTCDEEGAPFYASAVLRAAEMQVGGTGGMGCTRVGGGV